MRPCILSTGITALLISSLLPFPPTFATPLAGSTIRNASSSFDKRDMQWKLQVDYSGDTFFDGWTFFNDPDPSNGLVNYVDRDTAFREGLAFWTKDGIPGIQADSWTNLQPGQLRNSIRIHSKAVYNGGLFVADFKLMPWGCGVWPSFWTLGYGDVWPNLGEIDIVEGIQDRVQNQVTIHSTPGCFTNTEPGLYDGVTGVTDCDSTGGKTGCGILSRSESSYGEPFNAQGGGVFAMIWDESGIYFWNFGRNGVPDDITSGSPTPGKWGIPMATFNAASCDISKYFKDNQLVFTINLCDDWAGGLYDLYAHCPGTCAEQVANPTNLNNAIFLINSIKVYQLSSSTSTNTPAPPRQVATKLNAQGKGGGYGNGTADDSGDGVGGDGGGGEGEEGGQGVESAIGGEGVERGLKTKNEVSGVGKLMAVGGRNGFGVGLRVIIVVAVLIANVGLM